MAQTLNRSNHLKRHTSATLIPPYPLPPSPLSPPHSILAQISSLKKISARIQMKNRKHVLKETEERIFSQVIGLVGQIDELRASIATTQATIVDMQIAHPLIEERVQFHGYDRPLTAQGCAQLQAQNQKLVKLIKEGEEKQVGGLEEVLRTERQKYEQLKLQLASGLPSDSRDIEERVKGLKQAISSLQNQRKSRVTSTYPQFDELQQQNETLRQKTLTALLHNRTLSQQEQQLHRRLADGEAELEGFMSQLQSWKQQYSKIRTQNQRLRQRLRQETEEKENLSTNIFRASKVKDVRGERLGEYSSLIRRMQSLQR